MVFCHSSCLPYMPAAWQDLAQVDDEIIKDFKADSDSRSNFLSWLTDLKSYMRENFIQRHPDLCTKLVTILDAHERKAFYGVIACIHRCAFRSRGSNVFWISSERDALPPRWQLAAQESRLITHITTNEKDLKKMVEGLFSTRFFLMLDYPLVARSAMQLAREKDPHNPKLLAGFQKVDQFYRRQVLKQNGAGQNQ